MRHGLLDDASLQSMLYQALDHSDDIVLILEEVGDGTDDIVVASANDAFCRVSGYRHEELINRPLASLAAANAEPECAELARAAHEGRSWRSEMLLERKSGPPFWFGLHLMPARGTRPPCCVVLGRDITESMQARQQQTAVQSLLAKVFQCIKAPVAIVSDTGLIQMANPALDKLLGYPAGSLAGRPSIDCIAPEAQSAVIAARDRQIQSDGDYSLSTSLVRADGTTVPAELTSIVVQRKDLRRFRIVTVDTSQVAAPVRIHVAGKIRLIGLDDVKEALGSRWAAVAARAMASAEHVIHRHCGTRDTYSRTPDGAFLICFADATEEEAAFRAAAVAREIRSRLIGEGETEATAHVSSIVAMVHLPDVPGQSADMLAAAINERLNHRLAQIEARARETLREAVNVTACRLEPVRSGHTGEVVANFAKLPNDLERRFLAAYSTLPANERQNFDFDRLVLGIAADQAIAEIGSGASHLVLVNVDFEVFLERRRTERYVAVCQALDGRLRERLVAILSGMPRGFPKSRILECVMRLRPFCHGVGFQLDGMDAPSVAPSLLGASIVVLHDGARAARDSRKLAKLIDSLHACQARVMVRHLTSWQDAKPLARAGVDLFSMLSDEWTPPTPD